MKQRVQACRPGRARSHAPPCCAHGPPATSTAALLPLTPSLCAAADPLSQQALEVQAQDLALEDALYALDKALNSGAIEPDAYLKQARCAVACAVCAHSALARSLLRLPQ